MRLAPIARKRTQKNGQSPVVSSRLFKVIDFSANRKPVCDILLVNTANLYPIVSKLLYLIGQICVRERGRCLFHRTRSGWLLYHEIWHQQTRNMQLSVVKCEKCFKPKLTIKACLIAICFKFTMSVQLETKTNWLYSAVKRSEVKIKVTARSRAFFGDRGMPNYSSPSNSNNH